MRQAQKHKWLRLHDYVQSCCFALFTWCSSDPSPNPRTKRSQHIHQETRLLATNSWAKSQISMPKTVETLRKTDLSEIISQSSNHPIPQQVPTQSPYCERASCLEKASPRPSLVDVQNTGDISLCLPNLDMFCTFSPKCRIRSESQRLMNWFVLRGPFIWSPEASSTIYRSGYRTEPNHRSEA